MEIVGLVQTSRLKRCLPRNRATTKDAHFVFFVGFS